MNKQTRKRTFQEAQPKAYEEIIRPQTKEFISNKKFHFTYSLHKDGVSKKKSQFLGELDYRKLSGTFSLNYDKKVEILMLSKFKENLEKTFNKEEILNKHLEQIKLFESQKTFTKMGRKSKKIKKLKGVSQLKREKKEQKVRLAIELLKQNKLYSIIAMQTGLKEAQIAKIKFKLQKKESPFIVGKGRKEIIKPEYIRFIRDLVEKNITKTIFFHILDIKIKLMSQFEELRLKPPSISTIRKAIWKAGVSRKKTTNIKPDRNLLFSKLQRKDACLLKMNSIMNEKTVIYIDETGFNKNMIPRYGFSIKNQKCYVPGLPKSKNYSVICAVTSESVLGIQIFEGSIKSGDFACFLLQLISSNIHIKKNLGDYIFFIDNASSHHAEILSPLKNYIQIQYNAPYSPFLNPIEETFSWVKRKFRELNFKNNMSFLKNIVDSFFMISERAIYGFYINSLKYSVKCINNEEV